MEKNLRKIYTYIYTHIYMCVYKYIHIYISMGFPASSMVDILEEKMAIHSSILAWEIPWTEEPGGLQSMGSERAGHN